ncbi:hypothetical protein GJ744_002048 [Endocarpon pusillum]|uniref:Extracellular membrane protein CFEM domain-containing protein n=1 Tax=Endocarpon pusillum TaxID=364733 RepID=A0A8H7ACI3_9EURO|nr:hypothetical protein GJ744_002048 [Endocarpon pusillum]
MGGKIWVFYHLFLFVAAVHGVRDPESITLRFASGYKNLRACAQECFSYGKGNIKEVMTCSQNYNLCRADLVGDAHSAISSCIITDQCKTTNAVDVSLGVSFYDAYCSSYHAGVSASETLTVMESTPATSAPATLTVMEGTPATPLPHPSTVTVTVSSASLILSPSCKSTTAMCLWASILLCIAALPF